MIAVNSNLEPIAEFEKNGDWIVKALDAMKDKTAIGLVYVDGAGKIATISRAQLAEIDKASQAPLVLLYRSNAVYVLASVYRPIDAVEDVFKANGWEFTLTGDVRPEYPGYRIWKASDKTAKELNKANDGTDMRNRQGQLVALTKWFEIDGTPYGKATAPAAPANLDSLKALGVNEDMVKKFQMFQMFMAMMDAGK